MPNTFRTLRTALGAAFGVAASCACGQASAHALEDTAAAGLDWSFDPLVVTLLALSLALYAAGHWRLLRRSHQGRRTRRSQAACFLAGWLALVIALVSPLDALGGTLFSAHMVQHELLMIVAAPLLVLGRPLAVWVWAFPSSGRATLARVGRYRPMRMAWGFLTVPMVAWLLHGVALWGWHVPRWFESALRHPTMHTLQHWSFLASALLFWWTIFARREGSGGAHAMLSLFTTMVHTGALGALLTLAPAPWYPSYLEASAALGFDPLQDQQLGGLVMWVPGGIAFLAAALAVAARWLVRREGITLRADQALPPP
jgi:cytochrome c oxidase assembly factor CtaG